MNILITGGSSGIGAELAKRLSTKGNMIYITGRSASKLATINSIVEKKGSTCFYDVGEVGNTVDVKRIVADAFTKMEYIDVLILNAGTGSFKLVEEMSDDDFDKQFNTNVRGVFLFLREIIPHMRERKSGQIIVTGSNLGFTGTARGSIYSATKFAIQGMVSSIRQELMGSGVKLGTINPGSVDTEWFSNHDRDIPNPRRLDVGEVVDAFMLMINQGERSNINHILLNPLNS